MQRFAVIGIGLLTFAGVLAAGQGKPAAQASQKPAGKGSIAAGKTVFEQQCSLCHEAKSREKKMGPGLKSLYKRGKLMNGKPANDENVQAMVINGQNAMPPFKGLLTEEEIRNLLAYLKTL